MVKFRGITISIVSQFDICKLPEFRPPTSPSPDPFMNTRPPPPSQPTASCYVPIYPGSQIWFEYSVDGPHPENAAYFFKMFNNGQLVTSWDCTANYGYCGKAAYALEYIGDEEITGANLVRRQGFRFRSGEGDEAERAKGKEKLDDCVEIRVHRIEHRQRIALNGEIAATLAQPGVFESSRNDGLSGLLQPGSPKRRYRYQLLDPVDEPYATFRFYYRTYDFLEDNNIITYDDEASNYEQTSSVSDVHEEMPESLQQFEAKEGTKLTPSPTNPPAFSKGIHSPKDLNIPTIATFQVLAANSEDTISEEESDGDFREPPSQSNSEASLRLVTKDSIEDLPSTVPRSPKSDTATIRNNNVKSGVPASPSKVRKPSPKKLQKKKLTVNLGGTEFDLDKKKRPLSPFTSSGALRKIMNGVPPSAPAAVTEFGPTIWDEIEDKQWTVEEQVEKQQAATKTKPRGCERTTRVDRGGKSLMGFLGRRIAKAD